MLVIEAPTSIFMSPTNSIHVFLGGGISDCKNWQEEVIEYLQQKEDTDDLVILNPRRKSFNINDKSAANKQIEWEFNQLSHADIFSMYFVNSDSVQPICFYELGRYLVRMQDRFPETYKNRIIVSVEDGFSREIDVKVQTSLALNEKITFAKTPQEHAEAIYKAYQKIKKLQAEI